MSGGVIGLGEAAGIYAGMTWTRLKRGRLLRVCAALLALPVVGGVALMAAGHWGRGFFDELAEVYFRFLIPFVPALLASPQVAEEIEGRTFTFVFARPAPRSALVLGKYVAVVVPTAIAVAAALALCWLVAMLRFPQDLGPTFGHLARVEAAAVLGVATFAALASALGAMFTRHPFVAVMTYLLLVEAGLGAAPIALNLLAMSWHLRNLAELPLPEVSFMALHVPAYVSALVPVAFGGLCLGGATMIVSGAEYHGKVGS